MTEIMNNLETVSFGVAYFKIFKLLRESMFVNGTLTNADIWYGMDGNTLKELEDLDRSMIRKAFNCPISTPKEAGHLELGILPLSCIVKERRLVYLQYILKSDHSGMLYKFFVAQWEDETKNDWTKNVKCDLKDLDIKLTLEYIQTLSTWAFKNLIKRKIKEYALDKLNEDKFSHSKINNIVHT